jgi:competence protein ComEC
MKDVRANSDKLSHINLLKVAHHGSRYTSDEEFLKALRPGIALISCGEGNSYGHPHRELIERLDAVGTRIYRTDKSGAITVIVNNNRVYVDEFLAPL